jgi:two-component system OmpR family sensor kinase
MFLNSIRWRLQLWHGTLLVLVLVGFGFTAYHLAEKTTLNRIDEQLRKRTGMLGNAVRPPGRGPGPGGGPPARDPNRPGLAGPGNNRPFRRPPLDQEGEPLDFQPQDGQEPGQGLAFVQPRLPPEVAGMFVGEFTNFYYVVWGRERMPILQSSNAPPNIDLPSQPETDTVVTRTRGTYREMFHFPRVGPVVLSGRSIEADMRELHQLGLFLGGAGLVVLALGLAGGWWGATRAIKPIDEISETARSIADGNLSKRINVADTDNELGKLGVILNSTFSRLESSFARQTRFTADASHELRTPLSVILSQTQLSLSRARSVEEYQATLESCQRAGQRMRVLIEKLLQLARIDSGLELQRITVNLADVCMDAMDMVRPIATEKEVALTSSCDRADVVGDPVQLSQVVINLLANAIYYNNKDGVVVLTTAVIDGFAVISVKDTGPGIEPEDLRHIFERFYRADKSRNSQHNHTGLGLAIVTGIVEAHGGTIGVESQVGKGSTFTVKFPAIPNPR